MRGIKELPESYFDKFKNKKVRIVPFNPKIIIIASGYIEKLNGLLKKYPVEILHRGSTAFGIAGKGEVEIGVFPQEKDWFGVFELLSKKYGQPGNLEESYARFNDVYKDTEIEIIMMKGEYAHMDKKLTNYLLQHPQLLKEYEDTKIKYSYSKKEYMIQKDKFFRKVVGLIPEDQ